MKASGQGELFESPPQWTGLNLRGQVALHTLWWAIKRRQCAGRVEGAGKWSRPRWIWELGLERRQLASLEAAGVVRFDGDDLVLVAYDASAELAARKLSRRRSDWGKLGAAARWGESKGPDRSVDRPVDRAHQVNSAKSFKTTDGLPNGHPNAIRARAAEISEDLISPSGPSGSAQAPSRSDHHHHSSGETSRVAPGGGGGGSPSGLGAEPDGWAAWWAAFPRDDGAAAGLAAFEQLGLNERERAELVATTQRRRKAGAWTREGGRFVPSAANFLAAWAGKELRALRAKAPPVASSSPPASSAKWAPREAWPGKEVRR